MALFLPHGPPDLRHSNPQLCENSDGSRKVTNPRWIRACLPWQTGSVRPSGGDHPVVQRAQIENQQRVVERGKHDKCLSYPPRLVSPPTVYTPSCHHALFHHQPSGLCLATGCRWNATVGAQLSLRMTCLMCKSTSSHSPAFTQLRS